jgi:hypothetical protein
MWDEVGVVRDQAGLDRATRARVDHRQQVCLVDLEYLLVAHLPAGELPWGIAISQQ